MRYLYKDLNLCFHQSWYLAQLITKLMSTPVPNHPPGMGMTFPFSHAPGLIQPERERCLCSRGQPCAVRLPPQRRGSSKRKRLCFGSASHAQQSSFWAPQSYAQCSACGWAIRRRGARQCETLPVPCLQSTEPAVLLPFQEPLLGQGGAPRGVKWLLHHIPRCVFPIFPKKEQSCPQNDAFCRTADQK